MIKSGFQSMFESMIGVEGLKAVEECKRILPAVPQLIETLKREWNETREQNSRIELLLNRVATQNNLILVKLESVEFAVDPNKTEDMPPTLAHHLAQPENADKFVSETVT